MKKFFLIISASLFIGSIWAQKIIKKKTKILDGQEVYIEEFSKDGKLIFKKYVPDYSDIKNHYVTFIKAYVHDSLERITYEIFANSMFGYIITIPKYEKHLKPVKEYKILSGYYNSEEMDDNQFKFLSSINNFNDLLI